MVIIIATGYHHCYILYWHMAVYSSGFDSLGRSLWDRCQFKVKVIDQFVLRYVFTVFVKVKG